MKISPKAIAKILDLDLDYVIYRITLEKSDELKQKKFLRKKYGRELYALESLPQFLNPNSVSDDLQNACILRLLIAQCNMYPSALAAKVIKCKVCVEKINFVGDYLYYNMILSEDNQLLIRRKLAECHLHMIGDDKVWKQFMEEIR